MDKKMLQDTFREFKRVTSKAGMGVDYAITNPDPYGSEGGDVCYSLEEKYGADAKGVWANHYNRGYNSHGSWDRATSVYINHDLTDVQVAIFYQVVGKNYNIIPKKEDFDEFTAFRLFEKSADVWTVSYTRSYSDGKPYHDECVGIDAAKRFANQLMDLMDADEYPVTSVSIEKTF